MAPLGVREKECHLEVIKTIKNITLGEQREKPVKCLLS